MRGAWIVRIRAKFVRDGGSPSGWRYWRRGVFVWSKAHAEIVDDVTMCRLLCLYPESVAVSVSSSDAAAK